MEKIILEIKETMAVLVNEQRHTSEKIDRILCSCSNHNKQISEHDKKIVELETKTKIAGVGIGITITTIIGIIVKLLF